MSCLSNTNLKDFTLKIMLYNVKMRHETLN